MARRSSRPALYELSQTRLGRPQEGEEPDWESSTESSPGPTWLSPGAGIRVPGGFLVLGAVVLIAFAVVAWWVGYRQGVSRTEALMAAIPPGYSVDPLLREPAVVSETSVSVTVPEADTSVDGPFLDGQRPWHFVLAETNLEGADRLASFCTAQGLEVMVVPGHNTGLARIIALPGMATSSRQAAEVRAQEAQIAALGRQWKQNGGRTDFSDRYVDRIVAVLE